VEQDLERRVLRRVVAARRVEVRGRLAGTAVEDGGAVGPEHADRLGRDAVARGDRRTGAMVGTPKLVDNVQALRFGEACASTLGASHRWRRFENAIDSIQQTCKFELG